MGMRTSRSKEEATIVTFLLTITTIVIWAIVTAWYFISGNPEVFLYGIFGWFVSSVIIFLLP